MTRVAGAALLALAACIDAGQSQVAFPLQVGGTSAAEPFAGKGGWLIELERAELAFGPLYLCAGFRAGPLCEQARVEWLESSVVDSLDPAARDAGLLRGASGPVRSWMYDLGITSLLTAQQPKVLAAAASLAGNSVRIWATARSQGLTVPFAVEIPIGQEQHTEIGVAVVQKSASDVFEHDITGSEAGLLVRFDPRPWVTGIDFDALGENQMCRPGGPRLVCAGNVEQECAADGTLVAQRDCRTNGEVCIRATGCTQRARLDGETQGARAVRNSLVAGARPAFEWLPPP